MVTVQEVIRRLETWLPPDLAADWDNVGLQLGDPRQPVNRIVVALDVDETAVELAVERQAELLVVHHPLFFSPVRSLRWDQPGGRRVQRLAAAGVAVYAAHTNLDVVPGGVSDALAAELGLEQVQVLAVTEAEALYKLVVFVPHGYEDALRDALAAAGAGWIGNYSHCTFQASGQGTFLPREGTNPFIGEQGKLERVDEYRLETIVPARRLHQALQAMLGAHPYEEPAYDIYRLENQGESRGFGRIGRLAHPVSLGDLASRVRERLGVSTVRVLGDLQREIRTVAVCGGAGADYIRLAADKGADAYVTGDIKYHQAQQAADLDLALIDAGHGATELAGVRALARYLEKSLPAEITILVSTGYGPQWQVL